MAAVREIGRSLADPMALMLAGAAALYIVIGNRRDGIILLAALIPVLGVDALLEARSRKALKSLARAATPTAHVIRDGETVELSAEQVVPGDTMVLGEGDLVHADGVVRQAVNLSIDESPLTGESVPQEKRAFVGPAEAGRDEPERVYSGTRVLTGQGLAEIVRTGSATELGRVAHLVSTAETEPTPLQRRLSRTIRALIVAAAAVAVLVVALQIRQGLGWATGLITGVSLAMAAAPEEFPLVFTLFLTMGAWRLSRRRVMVRRLVSVETLGSTTVICTDKTGTLTSGSLALEMALPVGGAPSMALLEAAVLACEERPTDTLERAIVARARVDGVAIDRLSAEWHLEHDYAFDPAGKHMSHAWVAVGGEKGRVAAKGALEGILEHCAITDEARGAVQAQHDRLAGKGMRVLAVAERIGPRETVTGNRALDERELRLVGLLGFRDPLRPEVPAAVSECVTAGIAIKLLTGDHPLTAHAIAREAGLPLTPAAILTGRELDRLDDQAFERAVRVTQVFARVRPEHKYRIVDTLMRQTETVAMIGDGVNDAPALERASIGVSLGRRGTEVARAAADLVLLDDNFASLVAVVREGRHIYVNIQRAFLFLLAFHVPIVVLAVAAPLLQLPLLLMPVHLVWLELVIHPISALVFEAEPAPPGIMQRRPRSADEPLVGGMGAARSVVSGALLAVAALAFFTLRLPRGTDYARSAAMATLVAGALAIMWAERASGAKWRAVPFPRTARFWVVSLLVAGSVVVLIEVPAVAATFALTRLGAPDWVLAILVAFASVAWRAFGSVVDRRLSA
jgi:Ca2+-transporting ATPase